MMKKTILMTLIGAMIMLTGCSEEKVVSGEVNNLSEEQAVSTEQNSGKEDGNETSATGNQGYVFKVKDLELVIDAEAQDILSGLGEPVSYYEAPSCAFGDLDKIHTYNGFELDTYSLEGKDYISAIVLKDDSVGTEEGLYLGDTVDKVKEIYGNPTSEEGTMLSYEKDHMELCFILENGTVRSIEYRTMILE